MAGLIGLLAEVIRIIVTLTRPISTIVLNFLYRLVLGPTRPLPPIQNKILLMTATELAEKIRKKQLTSEEVVRAYIDRTEAVHPCINAVIDSCYADALQEAVRVDRLLAQGTKAEEEIAKETPLLGVPFTCKEAIGVKGMLQTCGLVRSKDHIAEEDGASTAMYRRAGAIPLTVTDVPELCMWWESCNHNFGFTRNPYDNARTVGGSSGGEGAIVTSAGALFGIGNDIAGSIRIPASFCGIYGHKPSRDVINNFGTFPFSKMKSEMKDRTVDFVSTGPMCRYAADLPLLVKVLSGNDTRIKLDTKVNFRNVKIYYLDEFPGLLNAAVPAVKNAVKKAVRHFEEEYGIQATPLHIPELKHAFAIWECKLLEYDSPPFSYFISDGNRLQLNLWWEFFKSIFRSSEHTWPAIYFGMVDRRDKDSFYHKCLQDYQTIQAKMDEIMSEDAVLLVPTHPEPPPHYLMTIPLYPNIAYTCIFNILGLPSSQIPAGLSGNLPIGLQAVSGRFQDHLSIATALELDKVFGGWISPGPIAV